MTIQSGNPATHDFRIKTVLTTAAGAGVAERLTVPFTNVQPIRIQTTEIISR